ncbi:RcpC/CpaB family pilus assembly protein [Arthrobacter sp. STN4]|uniref:Flp pilus assembly protein CpaB n=1 Tax=Arthrobacter sp. STN4 TaxID=2923276 RepID=UPI002119F752|nr:RcpC/CpaB family pilus assembly protein [Arthrobacter sp. STN4]MCQ9163597.1 RcpC/CpaB family pilus assembly protein [Arthrobacter sp. STN4]
MKARLLGGIAAIVLAILGTVMLVNYVNGADTRALAGTETTSVVVVQKAIASGTAVSSFGDAVAVKMVPKNMMAEGALSDLKSVQNKVAAMNLLPGDQISDARLTDAATYKGSNPANVPNTMQEISFSVTADRVVGGQLQPGDTAALYFSYDESTVVAKPGPSTKAALRKVLVVGMQAAVQGSSSTPTSASTPAPTTAPSTVGPASYVVTVALAPADAIKLVHAAEFGHVWVAKEAAGTVGASPAPLFKGDVFK